MVKHGIVVALGVALAGLLSACGSQQLHRPLTPAERMEVQTTTIPAVVGVLPSRGQEHEENLRRILDESGLFRRVALAADLDQAPDLAVVITGRCDRNPTTLVPLFTWMTLGLLPTWVHDGQGYEISFHPPADGRRRVAIACGPDRAIAFGWLAAPLNVLPGWTLTDPEKHPRYAHRLALEVARRGADLRDLLEP